MNFDELRTILKYVPQFEGRTFVVALDGGVIASENLSNVLLDLAVLRSLGIQVVLVFDASPQIEQLAESRGVGLSSAGGRGPTDRATLDVTVDAVGRTSNLLIQQLTALGVRTATANILSVRQAGVLDGTDQQFTGKIYDVDPVSLRTLLKQDILPVVVPLGHDRKGQTLALDANAVAAETGIALRAAKVIYAADDDTTSFLADGAQQFSVKHLAEALEQDPAEFPPGAQAKLRRGIRCCEEGVARVHLIPGQRNEALLAELFSSEGLGLMIHVDAYETIRPATPADVEAMALLTRRGVEEGQLLPRSREEILSQLEDYHVIDMDDNLIGIVALHLYVEDHTAEVASLYVHPAHHGRGYGAALMKWLEDQAIAAGAGTLFGYTTQASDYFVERCGFEETTDTSLVPESRREQAASNARNSKLVWKQAGGALG